MSIAAILGLLKALDWTKLIMGMAKWAWENKVLVAVVALVIAIAGLWWIHTRDVAANAELQATAESYRKAAIETAKTLETVKQHDANAEVARETAHAVEIAQLKAAANAKEAVRNAPPAPACPPDPAIARGLELLRHPETSGQ
jgi:hypothetical protein